MWCFRCYLWLQTSVCSIIAVKRMLLHVTALKNMGNRTRTARTSVCNALVTAYLLCSILHIQQYCLGYLYCLNSGCLDIKDLCCFVFQSVRWWSVLTRPGQTASISSTTDWSCTTRQTMRIMVDSDICLGPSSHTRRNIYRYIHTHIHAYSWWNIDTAQPLTPAQHTAQ